MASQGPNSAGTGANDASVGSRAWNNPSNIVSSNNTRAFAANANTQYLKATNFGFSIPGGATIDGIVVEIERYCTDSASNNAKDLEVKIVKGGSIQSTNRADLASNWPLSDAYATYGSSTDLWGTTWTDSDINSSSFGVVIRADIVNFGKGTVLAEVDHVRITVYYTTGGGGGSSTNPILYIGN